MYVLTIVDGPVAPEGRKKTSLCSTQKQKAGLHRENRSNQVSCFFFSGERIAYIQAKNCNGARTGHG